LELEPPSIIELFKQEVTNGYCNTNSLKVQ
jgi:hypothetical protein